jgi:hypothetical protein
MKKLSLAIAMVSLFSASAVLSSDTDGATSSAPDVQIFKQSFDVMVKKESEISIDPPKREMIDLNAEKLEEVVNNGKEIEIGSMEVETTAKTCYATIKTMNNFKLQGMLMTKDKGDRNTIASYSLSYKVENNSGTNATLSTEFTSNADGEQLVGCNTADLKMNVFDYNKNAPADAYNDVITVEVRAES